MQVRIFRSSCTPERFGGMKVRADGDGIVELGSATCAAKQRMDELLWRLISRVRDGASNVNVRSTVCPHVMETNLRVAWNIFCRPYGPTQGLSMRGAASMIQLVHDEMTSFIHVVHRVRFGS